MGRTVSASSPVRCGRCCVLRRRHQPKAGNGAEMMVTARWAIRSPRSLALPNGISPNTNPLRRSPGGSTCEARKRRTIEPAHRFASTRDTLRRIAPWHNSAGTPKSRVSSDAGPMVWCCSFGVLGSAPAWRRYSRLYPTTPIASSFVSAFRGHASSRSSHRAPIRRARHPITSTTLRRAVNLGTDIAARHPGLIPGPVHALPSHDNPTLRKLPFESRRTSCRSARGATRDLVGTAGPVKNWPS